jgi:gas vesicle protein
MTAAGFMLIGMAIGAIVGALAAYGAMFAWAIKSGGDE